MLPRYPNKVQGLELAEQDDGIVVYHPGSDRLHFLNHTAAVILELCNGRHTVEEIADVMRQAFRLPTLPVTQIEDVLRRAVDERLVVDDQQPW